MTKFQQIKTIVAEYQKRADQYFQDYVKKMERAKKRYSTEAFDEESKKIWFDVSGKVDAVRDIAVKEIDLMIEDIKKDFQQWLIKPIDANLIQTLNCIRNFEIPMGMEELRVLESETKKSFFGSKIFSEIAKENGYSIKVTNSKIFMDALKRVHDNAVTAVTAYAGNELIGKDLLTESKAPYMLALASNFLTKNNSIEEAESLWGENSIQTDFRLTKEEEKRIYDLVGNIENEIEKKERIEQLSSVEPDFLNKLSLMSGDYKEAVEKYIDSGRYMYVFEDN